MKKSFNEFLEKRGYKNPEVTSGWAIYEIDESFLGYKAKKFIVPKNGGSPYWGLVIDAPAEKIAEKIYSATKQRISIQTDINYQPVHGVAYLFSKGEYSDFVCYVNEGDD
jgi:hypothetical protein